MIALSIKIIGQNKMNHIKQTAFEKTGKLLSFQQTDSAPLKLFHHTLLIFLFSCSVHQIQAKMPSDCTDMIGQYNVAPFTRPLGLAEAARYFGLSKPLGEPVFKVEKVKNKFLHIGLVSGVKYEIALKTKSTRQNNFFPSEIIQCSYSTSGNVQIIKADLTKLPPHELDELADYIPRSWGSTIVDFGREEDFENPKINPQKLAFTAKSLRDTRYFLISHVEMTGVISYYQVIPLQKYNLTKKSK